MDRTFNQSYIPQTRAHHDKVDYNVSIDRLRVSIVYEFIFGGIAFVSFLGNSFLFVAICRRRSLLSNTYNVLVLNLAFTDMLTGE